MGQLVEVDSLEFADLVLETPDFVLGYAFSLLEFLDAFVLFVNYLIAGGVNDREDLRVKLSH